MDVTVTKDKYITVNKEYIIEDPEYTENIDMERMRYKFTITSTPLDANVTLNVNGNITTGIGTNTVEELEGTKVLVSVSKDGFESINDKEYVISDEDYTENITIKQLYTFTVVPNPADANVVINGENRNSITVVSGTNINWSVSKAYYGSQSGTYTMGTADHNISVTLTENPIQEITVAASSVTTSGGSISNVNNAIGDAESTSYANSNKKDTVLTWVFTGFNAIDDNAIITQIDANYRISQSLASSTSEMTINVDNTEVFKRVDDNVGIALSGIKYAMGGSVAEKNIKGAQVKKSLTLSAKKNSGTLSKMRWYGAQITVKYRNP